MYCYKCGKEIQEGSAFCPECGANQQSSRDAYGNTNQQSSDNSYYYAGQDANQMPYQNSIQKASYNALAVAGFVISIVSLFVNFCGLVGVAATVISAIGLTQCKKNNENGMALAIIGIVIGVISIIYGLYVLVTLFYAFDILGRIL